MMRHRTNKNKSAFLSSSESSNSSSSSFREFARAETVGRAGGRRRRRLEKKKKKEINTRRRVQKESERVFVGKLDPPFFSFFFVGKNVRLFFERLDSYFLWQMEERDDEEEEEEEEDASRRGGRRVGRRALPSKRAIDAAFEHLRQSGGKGKATTDTDDDDDDDDAGMSYRNLRDACDAFGFHHWTEADVENMIDAYELSESKGEIALVDINQSRRPSRRDDDDDDDDDDDEKKKKKKKNPSREMVAEVTKKGFLEIVRRCGAREAR